MQSTAGFQLRPYQQDAVQAVLQWFRASSDPALLSLPTGAGKSLVIAELARLARGRVLVLAHVQELVEQNHAKYAAYGLQADIFSAGLGLKQAERQVVFGSVQSVSRHLPRFDDERFTLLVIDECHRVSLEKDSAYQQVIQHLQQLNPQLKVLGLTATPYRLGQGFVYHRHLQQQAVRGDENCFFRACIYELPLRWMVRKGYLTTPLRMDMAMLAYDFSMLVPTASGYFSESEMDQVVQSSRVTPGIVADIQQRATSRHGVMIFCASVRHAEEVAGLLPSEQTALITGALPGKEREQILRAFKAQELKYLVNVSVLTTGFDAPHVDLIALLRPTESVSLYQQILGRGLRLSPDTAKADCLLLDYAGNPWDLWAPEISSPRPSRDSQLVQVNCPACGFANTFWGRTTTDGDVLEHFGRRCQGWLESDTGSGGQCDFRFRFRVCEACGGEADIAARVCPHCDATLVDADRKLKEALQLKDARVLRVSGMTLDATLNGRGLPRLKVTYHDEDGTELSDWYALETAAQRYAFEQVFLRDHLKAPGCGWHPASAEEAAAGIERLRHPDFVIARKVDRRHWRIQQRLFDYQGRFRKAEAAH
ncbi:DEAD/DEAH box helicase [Marinospirillum alkaliphilum]|uniref:ATP-dependent helicase IRC3 n=1 Tax=Marinospirillum alkaliphilum DSM 21637 TaxID=1122209 RepID=A0A1K1VWP7_9GAMM|nr:DEAD/DEAH box helicase [Marinospirillum alkaliphilum]SFX29076.1 ATP-dependent helicase IRC3 [Marinospirillum alkaliphilum DSM 21637]